MTHLNLQRLASGATLVAKSRIQFICQNCGSVHQRWAGKCDACGEWNTLVEEGTSGGIGSGPANTRNARKGRAVVLTTLSGDIEDAPRIISGIGELDRATGGGFVRGSALLVGGDPGIGKSTLLTQAAAALASTRPPHRLCLGRRSRRADQAAGAQRLGVADTPVELAAETNVEDILATIADGKRPDLVILDSIQTLWTDLADSAPGHRHPGARRRPGDDPLCRNPRARRSCWSAMSPRKARSPDRAWSSTWSMPCSISRAKAAITSASCARVKNRFGPTDEIGVFEMSDKGLREVANPSELFLGERHAKSPGAAVFAGMEGTRPVLVEIQALVAPSSLGTPRRAVVGWDGARLSMILAVLEAHCGVRFGSHDVYLNVAGGYRISEPAADLAVAAALVSSLTGLALPADCVYFGEISLSGAVRPVAHAQQRLKEAEKLGFGSAVLPLGSEEQLPGGSGPALSSPPSLPTSWRG